jgi:hypothetical protein
LKKVLLVVFAVALQGCPLGRGGFLRSQGDVRASFEMKCPRAQLKIIEINSTTVGVEGCGQSYVYKFVETGRNMTDWIRD